ncbi:MAG: hypothetical protein ACTSPK_07625 [Candidatus Heimdallarchaeota archaeon]
MSDSFEMKLIEIQPSQLYISRKKLVKINKYFDPKNKETLGVIPIKKLGKDIVFSDGHTRAVAAFLAGYQEIIVEWEDEDLDWEMYEVCVQWCKDDKIFSAKELAKRIISHKDYKLLWYKKCEIMQKEITMKRKGLI